ncbi:MAG: ABC transporter permease, partial [Spirochaetaceae bacterium]|nr:ABC transporter permease [Spirochaetaceae bacterium]
MKNIIQILKDKRLLWPVLAFILIIAFNAVFTKGFFVIQIKNGHLFGSIIDILNRGAPVILLSIGMTLVYAIGGIDLSVGAMVAIAGAAAAVIIQPEFKHYMPTDRALPPLYIIIILPLVLTMLFGLINGVLISFIKMQPIIATLILMISGRGIAMLMTRGQNVSFVDPAFEYIGSGFLFGIPFPVIIVIMVAIFTIMITRKTALGMYIEAIGSNSTASNLLGVNIKMLKTSVYMFSGFCAGMAGLIVTADLNLAEPNSAGLWMELDAIASVIIGGTIWGGSFSVTGSIIGALILQSLTTMILT